LKGAIAFFIGAFAMACAVAGDARRLPGPIIDPNWLQVHRTEVVVIDVRESTAEFSMEPQFMVDQDTGRRRLVEAGGHIPGALMMEFSKLRTQRLIDGRKISWVVPTAAEFEELMRETGIPADKPIVIVTQGSTPEELDLAARAYWTIKYYGGDDLAILDGGTVGWLEDGHPVVSAAAGKGEISRGDWRAGPPREKLIADSAKVAKALDSGVQLVDVRPAAFYFGLQRKPAVTGVGHIGGAVNFPPELHSRPVGMSQRFLSPAEYREILRGVGVRPEVPLIAYCNTGHMAAGAWFIASEVLGNHSAALYDGSLARWTAEGRPLVTTR